MTREQIEDYLVNEKNGAKARLDLLNKVTKAVAECRHQASPSKKIVTVFEKENPEYTVYWDVGSQAKREMRRLKVYGNGVKNNHAIDIATYPDKFTWEFLFDALRQNEEWINKHLSQLSGDLHKLDAYMEWHRILQLSVKELEKDRPEVSAYLRCCFGEVIVREDPPSPR